MWLKKNALVFSDEKYDFSNFVVSGCISDDVHEDNSSYICNSCSKMLYKTSVDNPAVLMYKKDKNIRAGALFLKALSNRPEFVCTCCHRMLFCKTVRMFKEDD